MPTHKRVFATLAATAAGALAATTMAATPAVAGNPNNPHKMAQAVSVDAVWEHLEAFQAIADEHGDRAAGTPGYEASAAYVESRLQEAGYETERQPFTFPYFTEEATPELEQVSPAAKTYVTPDDFMTMSYSGSGDVTAPVVAVDTTFTPLSKENPVTSGCEADDFAGFPAGSIALMQRGGCAFAVKALNAQAAGAAAAIVFNTGAEGATDAFAGTLGAPEPPVTIPVVGTSFAVGQELDGSVARVLTDTFFEYRETFNILAETAGGRDDNVVMLGAHLDGVEGGPGINDNGTGSAAILETAIQLADVNKLNNKVRFAWWGAEEAGLLGSWHYVDDLLENDEEELGRIATYLNFDMVGSPNHIIGVYDADESTFEAPVTVPAGSVETEQVLTDWFDSVGQPWVDTMFSGRSDYQPFIANGIPASGLFTGGDGVKTAEQVDLFGGFADMTYDPNYHTPADDIDNVDKDALDVMSDAVAAAAISLAQDTSLVNGKRSAGKSGRPHPAGDLPHGEEDVA